MTLRLMDDLIKAKSSLRLLFSHDGWNHIMGWLQSMLADLEGTYFRVSLITDEDIRRAIFLQGEIKRLRIILDTLERAKREVLDEELQR